ncbi:putative RNA-directed DNA polymerase [Rosa chinensis]|uniref:Putative RNA-directed DNA polymerase n=1 Tax=Rosa chinensis TaxID=74649 RepID=A0A2P6RDA6_ROSCH|nr:uncharacterized protein LOC121052049 [Rosa chinensis]PRQ44411.1 putative RNA-directed DNA polymerase [Rosa chinensis]
MNSCYSLHNIEPLNGSNFKTWKERIELYLGLQGLDVCLREPQPVLNDTSPEAIIVKDREWHKTNRMAKLIMKQTMSPMVRGSVAEPDTALGFMTAIGLKFKENEKAEISALLDQLLGMKFDTSESVREHIMKIIHITTRLGELEIAFSDAFIVHLALIRLPPSFGPLKTAYFSQKEKWDLNELIEICVQEEELIKSHGTVSVNLVNKQKWKGKGKAVASSAANSGEGTSGTKPYQLGPKKGVNKGKKPGTFKCFFCKKEGHIKKNCTGFKDWLVKKGLHNKEGTKEK